MSRKRTQISSPDSQEVERLLRVKTHSRELERLIVARMAMSGKHTLAMMAEAVGRARSCIQNWLDKFETGGVAGLLDRKHPPGRASTLSPQVQQEIKEQLQVGAWRTGQEFRTWLEQTHQISLSLAGCYYWLGKSGGGLKVPRPCHAKQVPGAVDEFKMEGWERQLASLELPHGVPVRFWVMDESRFGLHTVMRRCWGLRGQRVIKRCQQRYDWDYVYGAIDILSGEPVFCHLPTVSTDAAWQFLRELVKVAPDAHHVVLWDGAGFHQPPESAEPAWADLANVHPLTLPPYCPELNPTEKIWDQLKDVVCNKVFDGIEAMREELLPKLKSFWESPGGLSSLVGNNWLRQKVNAS